MKRFNGKDKSEVVEPGYDFSLLSCKYLSVHDYMIMDLKVVFASSKNNSGEKKRFTTHVS